MEQALTEFKQLRQIFEDVGIRPDGFCLPRQHSMFHYISAITMFGSPNGLCSSITESKHITAIKKPWRLTNRNNPLDQILQANVRLSKISAQRIDFAHRGMLRGDVLTAARVELGLADEDELPEVVAEERFRDVIMDDEDDADDEAGPRVDSFIRLAAKPGIYIIVIVLISYHYLLTRLVIAYGAIPDTLAEKFGCPNFIELCRRFLYSQVYDDHHLPPEQVDIDDCPVLDYTIRVYNSASATFYAPSEVAGPGGMHRELIRCTDNWRQEHARHDTVFIQMNRDIDIRKNLFPYS